MACRTLIPITKDSCQSNKGGLYTTVYATNRSNLTISADETTGIATLAWASGFDKDDMITYSFRKQSSGLTSEVTIDDATGVNFVTSNLNLVFARQDVSKRLAIQALILQEDLAVIVEDGNGEINLLGADDSVTATAATADKGTAATDANQYTVTLTDISKELPFYVTAANLTTLLS